MDCCLGFPSGMTCEPSTGDRGEERLMSCVEGSHARTSHHQVEPRRESMEQGADYGKSRRESLAKYDPDTRSWKTPQCSLFGDLEPSLVTFPRWGTMRDGVCWEDDMPGHLQNATESGYLPTPTKRESRDRSRVSVQAKLHNRPKNYGGCVARLACAVALENGMMLDDPVVTLNPRCAEQMMGWPIGMTSLSPLEMDKFQQWLRLHGAL
jgi:hypothetical protein